MTRSRLPLLLVTFGVAPLVRADDAIVHEYVPDADDADVLSVVSSGDPNAEPAAIVYDGEVLPAPGGGELASDEQAMSAQPGDGSGHDEAGHRSPTFRPDRVTTLEGTLGYYTVFTPTVAPFKRVSALDAIVRVDGVPVLGVASTRTSPVLVEGVADDGGELRDRFWGNVVVDFAEGRRVPLPSVAPDSRILSLRTEPEADVAIEKDAADNFYVVSDGYRGQVRIVFLTDAPRSYFAVEEIPDVVPGAGASSLLFALDDETRREALTFATELGLQPGATYRRVLEALTEHFRSFEESDEQPTDTGSIFLDLARAKKGVCRHRAYGFVITAQALGVPARFVQNEAHAWVEVMLPSGWMRIDLGGAAGALEAHGARDRPVYRSRTPDPLPQPDAYRRSYAQLRGDMNGLRNEELASLPPSGASGTGGSVSSRPSSERPADPIEALFGAAPVIERQRPRPLRLLLEKKQFDVFRGRTLEVTGRALDPDGQGAAGLRVEVLLRDDSERLLGVTVTGEDGRMRAVVGVPPDVAVGEYRLVVRSPGNEAFLPATAH